MPTPCRDIRRQRPLDRGRWKYATAGDAGSGSARHELRRIQIDSGCRPAAVARLLPPEQLGEVVESVSRSMTRGWPAVEQAAR